jgi:hypothetical protein
MVIEMERIIEALEADDNIGFCTACGEEADSCEPDAREYECDACGAYSVYGAEELMLGGGAA